MPRRAAQASARHRLPAIEREAGISYQKENNQFRLSLSQGTVELERERYRSATGLAGELQHQLDELRALGVTVQYAELKYPGANIVRNAKLNNLGGSYRHAWIAEYQPVLSVAVNSGTEENRRSRPDLGRKFHGARVAVGLTPAPRWSASMGFSYQRSRHMEADALLATTRRDRYRGLDATIGYAIARDISVRAEYQRVKNDSRISLYEYGRNLAAVKVRYEFGM